MRIEFLVNLRRCLDFLTADMRWKWAGLIPLAVGAAVLEALGAAAVFALIRIIGDPMRISALPVVSSLYRILPWHSGKTAAVFFTILVTLLYFLKNGLFALVAYAENKLESESEAALSRRLLKGYLSLPYAFHLRRNSAELIRNTMDSVRRIFEDVMAAFVAAVTEMLVVFGIIAVLMVTAPLVTLVAVAVLFSVLIALLRLTRRRVARWGAEEQRLRKAILQNLQQSLGGLKEVKAMGHELFFYETFSTLQDSMAHIRHKYGTLSNLPRFLVESVFVSGLFLVVLLVMFSGGSGGDIVPLLGLYAYGGFRLIPSMNRLLMHLTRIRYGGPAVSQIHQDLMVFAQNSPDGFDAQGTEGLSFTDSIVVTRVSYAYEGSESPALRDIDLTIRHGESVGIVGPTGAGKSTLINIILGLLQPSSGRVTVDGTDIFKRVRLWQRKIGYVPQDLYLIDDSLRRNIAFGLRDEEIDEKKVKAAIHMAQIDDFVRSLPEGLDTIVGERGVRLSGGQRQRIAIARALYHEPELLVFDEATSNLDIQTEHEVIRAIEALRGEKSLLIVAHRLSTVRLCDRLLFLAAGRVKGCGSFAELMACNSDFRRMAMADDMASAR